MARDIKPRKENKYEMNSAEFNKLKTAVFRIPLFLDNLIRLIPTERLDVRQEYLELKGTQNLDASGYFDAVASMRADMIGKSEKEWFRKVAKFTRRVINALLEKPLDDTSEIALDAIPKLILAGKLDQATLLFELQQSINTISEAFPQSGREV